MTSTNLLSTNESAASTATGRQLKAITLLLPVWGTRYTQQFLEITVPTLLAPGNLPALIEMMPCELQLLTSTEHDSMIRQHPAFASLNAICPVTFRQIDHLITARNSSTTVTLAFTEAIRACGADMLQTCFFFLVADYIIADGSLKNVFDRIAAGKSAVFAGNFQVSAEETLPWIRRQHRSQTDALTLSARYLMEWALAHLHPATMANFVDNQLIHNPYSNRLFFRVDRNTFLGRFYLMHMVAIHPELTDFSIGSSCDYSFVPEMCPSGNVAWITDSDDYFVLETQPADHQSDCIEQGPMRVEHLIRTLGEWTTVGHRHNAEHSVVFHAADLPATLPQAEQRCADYVGRITSALAQPAPSFGHFYWQGALAAFKEAKGQPLSSEEFFSLYQVRTIPSRLYVRLREALFGRPPLVRLVHPRRPDYRNITEHLAPFLADPSALVLCLAENPSPLTLKLASLGERLHRVETSVFLKRQSSRYKAFEQRFDLLLVELGQSDVDNVQGLLEKVVPLLKERSTILFWQWCEPADQYITFRLPSLSRQLLRYSNWISDVDWVPMGRGRRLVLDLFARVQVAVASGKPLSTVTALISAIPLLLITLFINLFLKARKGLPAAGVVPSSFMIALKVDRDTAPETITAERAAPPVTTTREPQYDRCLDLKDEVGLTSLGLMTNQVWHDDPRRLAIVLSRYKFVAKMLSGRLNIAEVGCGDAFGTRIVQQEVDKVTAYDFDPIFIDDVLRRNSERWQLTATVHDILSAPLPHKYDAIYSLDVIEHIAAEREESFLQNICGSLEPEGVLIIGTPSLQSQAYASAQSKAGHINCKTADELKSSLQRYFHSVFIFSMNDEVIHTGFYPMAHYLFAICCHRKAMID